VGRAEETWGKLKKLNNLNNLNNFQLFQLKTTIVAANQAAWVALGACFGRRKRAGWPPTDCPRPFVSMWRSLNIARVERPRAQPAISGAQLCAQSGQKLAQISCRPACPSARLSVCLSVCQLNAQTDSFGLGAVFSSLFGGANCNGL